MPPSRTATWSPWLRSTPPTSPQPRSPRSPETAKGQRLTAGAGIWNPAPVTLRYQWKRNGLNIAGATGASYILGAADVRKTMTVTVTGSKAGYTTLARVNAKTRAVTAR
ncbi:hypothetical protein ACFVTE_14335 [Arthrobacter sp. NPDC058097]|uniref:hypothetical protein n=1 Tax=Arthrobacter sp. NPDC058097 TaxID=3346340 RepID=UPI0036D7A358